MKKFVLILLSVLMLVSMVGCKKDAAPEQSNDAANQEAADGAMRVAVIYAGFLGDKSFNDSCHEGVMKAKEEFGIEVKELESKEPAEWESNFLAAVSDSNKYDLIIGSSTQFQEIFEKHCPDYPNQKFAIIDGVVKGDNIISSTFAQNEGSFLAGAAAALFTTMTDIPNVNEDKVIGWVGGMDIPVLQDFYIGYEQGAKYIDPEITILQSFAGVFTDPIKGKELTLAQYDQGADIVMNVASGTGTGILEAAKETGKYAIGVDQNQDGVYPGNILTSMLKNVDTASYLAIKSVVEGTYEGGTTVYLDIANGGVSLTDFSVMREALGDKFPEELVDQIKDLEEKIKSGEIVVEAYEGFGRK